MLGGTQVNGPTTTTYGANFEIVSSVTEIDTTGGNFDEVDVDSEFLMHLLTPLVYLMVMPSTHQPKIWVGVLKRPIYSVGDESSSLLGYSTSEGYEW